jgi:serine/threonine protein kinase
MRTIDGYHIFAELKRGPVTTIFKALDARHNRVVLIKMLEEGAAEGSWRTQLQQESKLSARLTHPNLRRIYQSGAASDEPYLVLEYVEGPTLAELIGQHRRLPIDLCIFIAKELAKALSAIHRNNVLHRDIKPQNIFLSMSGQVKLGDLGLAQDLTEVDILTAGTPAYMSPEQVLGREVNEASDLFSFGAVLYEMLTGETAFSTRTVAATFHHVVNWEPLPVTMFRPEIPGELAEISKKLLAKNPLDRYASAETVLDYLTWFERGYGLSTSSSHLSAFLESPESYRRIELRAAAIADQVSAPIVKKNRHSGWGLTVVLNALMFFAGVLFIKGVKTYFEYKSENTSANNYRSGSPPASLASHAGFLDVRVTPADVQGVISVGGDSAGTTPLARPLELSPGWHEVSIHHPRLGVKRMNISITPGDTLLQTIDLSSQ